MSPNVDQLIEFNVQDVVKLIVEEEHCSVTDALHAFYSSRVFRGLLDPETGLYLQSPSYLYELYKRVS